ncbi:hypothetical protein H0H92_015290 [Tricholoma furcatifolium]|nr:hypothetical protein H0H92_015290 [Tricholoma furcatifolium]
MPESATISRPLAVAMLTSTSGNRQCLHHMYSRKQGRETGYTVTGIEAPRSVGRKDDEREQTAVFECGCREDLALWDFLIWKAFTVSQYSFTESGTKTLYIEAFGPMTVEPRRRLLLSDALKRYSGLTIDDMFTGPGSNIGASDAKFPDFMGPEHQILLCDRAVERLQVKREILVRKLNKDLEEYARSNPKDYVDFTRKDANGKDAGGQAA